MTPTVQAAVGAVVVTLAALAVVGFDCAAYWRSEAHVAEANLRSRQRWHRPQRSVEPQPPPPVDLEAWDREVDGLPWGYGYCWTRVADVRTEVDEDGKVSHRLVPERPSTAMVRRIVAGMDAA